MGWGLQLNINRYIDIEDIYDIYNRVRDQGHKTVPKLAIVQYICNTTFLYQNLMGSSKRQKTQMQKMLYFLAAAYDFL